METIVDKGEPAGFENLPTAGGATDTGGPGPAGAVVELARRAAFASGLTGLLGLVAVVGGEVGFGRDFIGTPLAAAAGWTDFASTCLLVLGVTGLLASPVVAGVAGARRAAWAMQLAATLMAGAAATLPLVVVGTHERYPDLVDEPPVAVPATYILAGFALAAAGIALAVALRRAGSAPGRTTTFLVAASVVAMVPLPAKHFLLAFAVAALLGGSRRRA